MRARFFSFSVIYYFLFAVPHARSALANSVTPQRAKPSCLLPPGLMSSPARWPIIVWCGALRLRLSVCRSTTSPPSAASTRALSSLTLKHLSTTTQKRKVQKPQDRLSDVTACSLLVCVCNAAVCAPPTDLTRDSPLTRCVLLRAPRPVAHRCHGLAPSVPVCLGPVETTSSSAATDRPLLAAASERSLSLRVRTGTRWCHWLEERACFATVGQPIESVGIP